MVTEIPKQDIAGLSAIPDWFASAFDVERVEDYVDVDGIPIHYFRWGSPDQPGVVLTHGFMAHARCWAFIAPLLAQDYCLVAFDLSGMGDSGSREFYDVASRAQECRRVAEHAGLTRKPALVCHSYGGSVGLTAVMEELDFWGKFIVCDMTMLAPGEPSRWEEERKQHLDREVKPHRVQPDYASIRARFRLAPDQPCDNQYLLDYMAWHSVKQVEGGYVWKFDPRILNREDDRSPEWWSQIAPSFVELTLPRAIIYGEHSEMMSEKALAYLASETKGQVPLVQIENAYHHIMLDQPIAFADAIRDLLEKL